MKTAAGRPQERVFLDIPNAAEIAGFSARHFRRIITEQRFRVIQIGPKFFILADEFKRWQKKNPRRVA
jgi:hypothetical protein